MLRKDYLQRQFEEFGKALAKILSFKRDKDWEEFEKAIAEATKKFTPFEFNYVEELGKEEFEEKILRSGTLLPDQQKILANLLYEKMQYYQEINNSERYENLKSKCLAIYQAVQNNLTQNEFDLEVHYRIELLKNNT